MTINMMVMFGLVIAVGVLVDDPVVVVEYAERKLQEGVPKREAFIMAMRGRCSSRSYRRRSPRSAPSFRCCSGRASSASS
jgi:hypothetical protein